MCKVASAYYLLYSFYWNIFKKHEPYFIFWLQKEAVVLKMFILLLDI